MKISNHNILFKSPLLLYYVIIFGMANFIIALSLTLMNEIIRHKTDEVNFLANSTLVEYDKALENFSLSRAIISAVACPVLGGKVHLENKGFFLLSFLGVIDLTKKFFKSKSKSDVRLMVIPSFLVFLCFAVFSVAINSTNFTVIQIALVALSINSTWVYVLYTTGRSLKILRIFAKIFMIKTK